MRYGHFDDERREYVIANSVLKHQGPLGEVTEVKAPELHGEAAADAVSPLAESGGLYHAFLFATPTCPNCRIACSYMDKAGFEYEKLMAAENADLAKKYGVKQAPTLVVTHGDSFEKYAGAGAIKQYVTSLNSETA